MRLRLFALLIMLFLLIGCAEETKQMTVESEQAVKEENVYSSLLERGTCYFDMETGLLECADPYNLTSKYIEGGWAILMPGEKLVVPKNRWIIMQNLNDKKFNSIYTDETGLMEITEANSEEAVKKVMGRVATEKYVENNSK